MGEIDSLKKKRNDVDKELGEHESMIKEQNQELQNAKREEFKRSLLEDVVETVEYVDRKNWREPNQGSSSSDDEEETESEIGPSQKNTNYLEMSRDAE